MKNWQIIKTGSLSILYSSNMSNDYNIAAK